MGSAGKSWSSLPWSDALRQGWALLGCRGKARGMGVPEGLWEAVGGRS